jgi:hypothetical protein
VSKVSAKVLLESPSTLIQLRENGDRTVAQIKLSKADHLPVIEGLLGAVLPHDDQTRDEIMELVRAKSLKEYL